MLSPIVPNKNRNQKFSLGWKRSSTTVKQSLVSAHSTHFNFPQFFLDFQRFKSYQNTASIKCKLVTDFSIFISWLLSNQYFNKFRRMTVKVLRKYEDELWPQWHAGEKLPKQKQPLKFVIRTKKRNCQKVVWIHFRP